VRRHAGTRVRRLSVAPDLPAASRVAPPARGRPRHRPPGGARPGRRRVRASAGTRHSSI